MPNLHILNNNIIDRATLSATNAVAGVSVDNLKSNRKGLTFRSAATATQLTAVLNIAELVGLVVLPICNLTPASTVRVRCYSDVAASALLHDSGNVAAVAAPAENYPGWNTAPAGVAGFAYGGGSYAIVWLSAMVLNVRSIVIDINDPTNPQGFIELSRLVVGKTLEVGYNPDWGAEVKPITTSSNTRNDAGDQITQMGIKSRSMRLDLNRVHDVERPILLSMMQKNGIEYPFFVSLFPKDTDKRKEHDHSIYGKLNEVSAIKLANFNLNTTSINIEEF